MTHFLGQQFGDYRLVRLLDSGGFADVYEAEHLYLPGDKAAIKLLKESFTPQQIESLRQEALLVSTLNHPHIVQLRTFSMERGIPHLVMSYAQGGSLDKRYPPRVRLTPAQILSYVHPIAQALHYAHQRRIVHRDLKPANLLLTQEGHVQIADFGLAVAVHSSTTRTVQEIAGTLAYMSPEQLQGLAGPASDQYALAIIVYQWLCGVIPFDGNGGNLYLISQQHMHQQPPSLREKLPDLSPSIEHVVMRALSKNPGERFASVLEFAQALEEASRPPFVPVPRQRLGDYQLIDKLGEGGFAEVYKAEHVHLGTIAAIKLLKGTLTSTQVEVLRQEARAIIQLDHPNIIRAYGFSIEQNIPYLVMAFASGGSLETRHTPGTRVPVMAVCEYVRQIASALQYAHNKNITHRDIKPANILLTEDGRLQVADFGIAVMAQVTMTVQEVVGSWVYMAPEQFQGRVGPASDQYALGIMVYQWLCGVPPFAGNSSMYALPHQHMNEPPPPLRKHVSTLSPRIEQVIMRALSKESAERYPSIEAFAQAFEEACTAPVTNPPKGTGVKPPQPSKGTSAKPPQPSKETGVKPPQPSKETGVKPPPMGPNTPAGKTLLTYKHASGRVNTVVWSPDNTCVASGGDDGNIRIWKVSTGKQLLTVQAHPSIVNALAWSSNGQLLASGGNERTICVWDTSGKLQKRYEGHAVFVNAVAWSSDGRMLASGGNDSNVHTWEASSGNLLQRMHRYESHTDMVNAVVWSPDGRMLASASKDQCVQVWEVASGKLLHCYKGHSKSVYTVVWSPDGQLLASGGVDRTIQVWEATSGKLVRCYKGHSDSVHAVAWSPDGRLLASASKDKTVHMWEAASGKLLQRYAGHSAAVHTVAWSPDGQRIASGGWDKTVQVWETASGKLQFRYEGHTELVHVVAWSPDGRLLASASNDKTVHVWEATSGKLLNRWWEGASGKLLQRYTGHSAAIFALAWSPDGRLIASASNDETVQVWEAATSKLQLRYKGHTGFVRAVAWSPDGRNLASGGGDKTVQTWSAVSGAPAHSTHAKQVNAVAWSPNGQLLASASNDETVQVWQAASSKLLHCYKGHSKRVNTIAWSPDGLLLASASHDKTVQVWQATSGKLHYRYEGHSDLVRAVAWSPNGRLLASASQDKTVQVWEFSTGKTLFTYREHSAPVYAIAWSSDGTRIVSAGNEVYVWQAP